MISLTVAHEHNLIPPDVWSGYIMYQPLFWMPTFLLGIATYRLAAQWSLVPDQIATVISIMSVAALLVLAGLLSPPVGGDFLVNGGAAPLIALIVLAYSHPRCLSSPVLGSAPLEFLGVASYVIYIIQAPLWHIFRVVTDHLRHAIGQPVVKDWQFALYLVYLVGIALLIQRFVERPAQHYLSRKGAASRTAARIRSADAVARRTACGSMSMRCLGRESVSWPELNPKLTDNMKAHRATLRRQLIRFLAQSLSGFGWHFLYT